MPYFTNLADIARRTGYPVVEQPGWRGRGHGAMSGVRSVVCHHDAARQGAGTFNTVIQNGRSDLPGPLAQFALRRDGTIHVVAAGLSYHAGATINDAVFGNSWSLGIEAGNDGVGEVWPERQLDAYAKLCLELSRAFGFSIDNIKGHKEICRPAGRKSDPTFDMNAFRARVRAVADGAPAPGPRATPIVVLESR